VLVVTGIGPVLLLLRLLAQVTETVIAFLQAIKKACGCGPLVGQAKF
jgi:Na+-transporting methylmalonyl-CoA/oxaloacetate decarboxylase gamma subunit